MDWNELLSAVLQAVLVIVLPPLVLMAVKWLQAKAAEAWHYAEDFSPNVTSLLEDAAEVAVKAAEQAGAAGFIADKKEYAISIAEKWLAEHNVKVDLDLLDAEIEKAVYDYFTREKLSA